LILIKPMNAFLSLPDIITKHLLKIFIILFIPLTASQILLYDEASRMHLNPIYDLEKSFYPNHSQQDAKMTLIIKGNIPPSQNVFVRKNGIPQFKITDDLVHYIHISKGDILEFDARKCNKSYWIIIESTVKSNQKPLYHNQFEINNKLYRLIFP
jgi:hypothetical protein